MAVADTSCPHIAIVGGGMVGVSLALMLAGRCSSSTAIRITLIEQFPFPEHDSHSLFQPSFDARSTALSAGSVAILQSLGCWEALRKHAEPIGHIHISDRGHYGNTLLHAQDYSLPALGYVIENRWLGQCLLARLEQLQQTAPIHCMAPATVERCQLSANAAELSVRHRNDTLERVTADVVLIADGAKSPLRKTLGIDTSTTSYKQSAIITNVALQEPHQGVAYERFTQEGPLAVLPLETCKGTHRASVVWTRNSDLVDDVMSLEDSHFLSALQSAFGYRAGMFTHVGQRHCYPLELVESVEQVRSRIVVAGNAAHFLHPVAGQGFNLSLRDSEVLADVLLQAHQRKQDMGSYSVLSEYEQQRERDQQVTIGLTDTMVNVFSSQKLSLAAMRQIGLLSLQVLPPLKHALAKQMMGMA